MRRFLVFIEASPNVCRIITAQQSWLGVVHFGLCWAYHLSNDATPLPSFATSECDIAGRKTRGCFTLQVGRLEQAASTPDETTFGT